VVQTSLKQERSRRPDTRPAEIMEAALEVFSAQGFRATTLDQVAEAAGVTKGAIYHYFKGKEDLLLQAMSHWLDTKMLNLDQPIFEAEGPASTKLRLLVRHMWARWQDPKTLSFFRLMEGELVPEFPEVVREWHQERIQPILGMLAEIVEEGKTAGEFRKDLDTPVLVHFLTAGLNKFAAMHFDAAHISPLVELPPDRVIDSIFDVLFRGIRAVPGM